MRRSSSLGLHVTLHWRDDVLAFRRLTGEAGAALDTFAPIPCASALAGMGARVSRGGAFAVAPADTMATIVRADGRIELHEGPVEVPLAAGDALDLRIGDFRFEALAEAPEVLPRATRRRAAGALGGLVVAALAHAVVFGLAAHDALASSVEAREEERTGDLRGLLATAEQRARAVDVRVEDVTGTGEGSAQNSKVGDGRKGGGARAAGEEGAMGDHLARGDAHRRYAVAEEVKKDPAPSASRAEALADAGTFGMIGLLASGEAAPGAPFADPWAHGADAIAAQGELWGQQPGEAFGAGGLGLSGIGEGGGGRGEGIGLGAIGALGHTDGRIGSGTGGDGSPGHGGGGSWGIGGIGHRARLHTGHHYAARRYSCSGYGCSVSGRLPPESIRRIVRQNFGRFRACYEQGLGRNPALDGTVTTRFVIGHDGAVSNVANGGSTLPDAGVVSCVVRAFYGLGFPQPEGGIVTVTYPIVFSHE
jgi:hypothetical protein